MLSRWFLTICLALVCSLTSSLASAHQRAEAKLRVDVPDAGQTSLVLEMHEDDLAELLHPEEHLLGELPSDLGVWREDASAALGTWLELESTGQRCALELAKLERVGLRGVRLTASTTCAADTVRWRAHEASSLELRAATRFSHHTSGRARGVLHRSDTSLSLVKAPLWHEEAARFLVLGVEHIVTGWDHLAFLLALVLACATLARLFWVISGFTLAHSITLIMGAMGMVQLSGAIVEPVIAASIAFAAALQLARLSSRSLEHPGSSSHEDGVPWPEIALCIGFGLIHGLGFAGMLADALGEQTGALLVPVLAFNAGVELGQLGIVLVVFPGLVWVGGTKYGRAVFAALLVGLIILGVGVTLARVMS